jgi:hypothetical protein
MDFSCHRQMRGRDRDRRRAWHCCRVFRVLQLGQFQRSSEHASDASLGPAPDASVGWARVLGFLDCVRRISRRAVSERRTRLTVARLRLSVATDASVAWARIALSSNGRDTWQPLVASDASVAFVGRATTLLSEPPL